MSPSGVERVWPDDGGSTRGVHAARGRNSLTELISECVWGVLRRSFRDPSLVAIPRRSS